MDIMDQYDRDESDPDADTDPEQFFEPSSERISKYNSILEVPDLCLVPPSVDKMLELHLAQEDPYTGKSKLRFSAKKMKLHKDLINQKTARKIPSSKAVHDNEIQPPYTDEITKLTEQLTQTLLGKRISRRFHDGIYIGTITFTWTDDDHNQMWHIRYDDNDNEDLDLDQIRDCINLYKIYPHEYRFNGQSTTDNETHNSTNKETTISNDRGATIQNDRGAQISAKRGATNTSRNDATITKDRGAAISTKNILSDTEKDELGERRSTRLKRKQNLPEKCINTIAKLGVIMFTSSAIVQPLSTSALPPIS